MTEPLRAGKDMPLFEISDRWRLAADRLQWVLQRREGRGWRGVRFVPSEKRVLLRDIRELGVEPTAAGQACLDALPDTFSEFRDSYPVMEQIVSTAGKNTPYVREPTLPGILVPPAGDRDLGTDRGGTFAD